jgi:BlaI family transcriptional regulator, penicillinase repressor
MPQADPRTLTPLELKVMNLLWSLKQAYVKDLVAHWPEECAPAYNTVSTVVRILEEKKGFVGHQAVGRSHLYHPLISRRKYQQYALHNLLDNVFAGSLTGMVSTLLSDGNVSREEIEELRDMIDTNGTEA